MKIQTILLAACAASFTSYPLYAEPVIVGDPQPFDEAIANSEQQQHVDLHISKDADDEKPLISKGTQPQSNSMPILEAGTKVAVFLDNELTGKESKAGDFFPVTVLEDVVKNGTIIIPAGAKGIGEVRFASGKGGFGRAGLLDISLRHVELCERNVALRGRFRQEGKNNNGAVFATWVAVGIFSGFITGKQGIMPKGQELQAATAEDIDASPCTLEKIPPKAEPYLELSEASPKDQDAKLVTK